MEFKQIITWMDWATIIFAFLAMFVSGINFYKRMKDNDEIQICIIYNNTKKLMPIVILRKHFTRAEVQGVLRALNYGKLYSIKYLLHEKFSKNILNIQNGKSKKLNIILEEGDSFDWSNY